MFQILWIDKVPISTEWKQLFEGQGCAVDVALSGEQALRHLSESGYDCVITGNRLVDANATLVCRKVKSIYDCPVIFYSEIDNIDVQKLAFSSGADDYILKNDSFELLWLRVLKKIEAYRISTFKKELSYPPMRIDVNLRKVFVNNNPLALTTSEFSILHLLAATPNRVLSQSEIYKTVWGEDSLEQPQTVQVHVSRIRRKLSRIFVDQEIIETVWGAGYRFAAPKAEKTKVEIA